MPAPTITSPSRSASKNCWRAFARRCGARRRRRKAARARFRVAGLEIDFEARRVRAQGEDVRLTPKEFELLRYLVAHAGKPVTHRELLQAVWGPDYGDEPEYLRVFVNQVRKKIEAQSGAAAIHRDGALGGVPLRGAVARPPHPTQSPG